MRFLATGGTFDKDYNPITGELYFPNSQVASLLAQANVIPHAIDHSQIGHGDEAIVCDVILQKDSLAMTDDDRVMIGDYCLAHHSEAIVIIHGTDTMVKTAEYLRERVSPHQCIVLTGAMRPAAFQHSDALFNLGFAMACARLHAAGVYVAMNGMCFRSDQVVKNTTLGRFEQIVDA